ncbi:metallophosphoesterase family protein [Magnetofaba australis]|uniref:Putative phosphodiesterase, MJ0936 family n=1 Tax=Magnetofaba australis IT-1 TaxID=1434232 RepID=A0A1Y2K3P2_9PROT|nr:metallophosphoesterase family protein [Magnetofaba australis]OSM02297.1 putative phosphodiesterase, MJ0936 family [Magnetofaba australis IT-1]
MRIALLADIHGNGPALRAVLQAARDAGAKQVLAAGDLCGYYYDTADVLEQLDQWTWFGVQGNHEGMLQALRDGAEAEPIRRKYGSALNLALRDLPAATLDRLRALPHPLWHAVDGKRILICHGAPDARDRYIYPDADEQKRAALWDSEADLTLFGHTHYPVLWRVGQRWIVNPGSVGQPRDRQPGACWALYDAADHSVTLRREPYDPQPLLDACAARDPDVPYLREVLIRTS